VDAKPVDGVVIQMPEDSGDWLVWNEYYVSLPASQSSELGPATWNAQAQLQPQMSPHEPPSLQQCKPRIRIEAYLMRNQLSSISASKSWSTQHLYYSILQGSGSF